MHIDDYSFGHIVIDGASHNNDVMLCGDNLYANWWRNQGHSLSLDDLTWMLDQKPDKLIVGRGSMGRMTVPDDVRKTLEQKGISIETATTDRAVERFNEEHAKTPGRVGAALHLTC